MQKFLLANSNCRGYLLLLLFSWSQFIFPVPAFGQCPNDNTYLSGAVSSFPCDADAVIQAGAGTYVTFPVISGAIYSFRACGTYFASSNTFDTKLTAYNSSGGAFVFYNDDNNGFVSGANATTAACTDANSNFRDSYVGWTSTFTGTLRVMVDAVRNVDPNGCNICTSFNCPALGSALLTYRQTNNLTFTSSNATLCSGQSVALTATPAGGTFSGTGVSGSTFTAPGVAGPYTITYTLGDFGGSGGCSVNQIINVNSLSVAPAGISGTTAICPGGNTTLTVSGGSLGTGAQWFWYSGSCGGTPVASGVNSINVSPGSATTYFVRAQGTCNTTTCASVTVTINPLSTDPTSISGTTTICTGGNTTLTVQGGSLGTGAQWFWYSGSCGGTFVASGTSSINVNPASPTTYYVRAQGTCNTTNCTSVTVNIASPSLAPGSVTASNSLICNGQSTQLTANGATLNNGGVLRWYSGSCGGTLEGTGSPIVLSPTVTTTYYVRAEDPAPCNTLTSCASVTITVNQASVAPTVISGNSTVCVGGSTTLTVADGSLGSGADWQWYSNSCGGTFVGSGPSVTVSPVSNTTYFVRAEGGFPCTTPTACASLLVTVNSISTAPGSVSVTSSLICNGQSTQLTANGATLGTGGVLTWYSASCGGTLVGTGNPIIVSPASTTTYYVRAEDPAPCSTITSCASTTITVNEPSVAPTGITGISTICIGGNTTLTVDGGLLGTGANWQWYSNSCGGTIVGSGPSIVVSPISNTTYFVRAEGPAPCPAATACASLLVNVSTFSSSPTSVAGTNTVCEGNSTTLTVVGGALGNGANWQWYEGGCGTGAPIGSGNSIAVTLAVATDYYVRAEGTCDTTSCAFVSISVNDSSQPAASINAGSPAICIGGSTNLTVVGGHLGVGATWNWYSGSCGGTLEGTGPLLNVSPVVTTTYYLRAEGLCNSTVCTQFTVTINPLPNGNIGGSATICAGTVDTVLTFNFSVGTGPFDIDYTDGTTTFSRLGVNNGDTAHVVLNTTTTYTYSQIVDANGCVRNSGFSGGATITFVPLPVITFVAPTDVLCNGGSTGTITITGSTGTPPYTYSTDGGATFLPTNPITGLSVGNYNLAIADAFNCSSLYSSNPVVIDEPAVLDHTTVVDNASCANVFDGRITINATGGVIPYNYSLNGGPSQLGNIFSGLTDGTYNIQVTDFNGCTDTSQVFIDTVYAVEGSIVSQTDVSCFGGLDGTVTVQLAGGIPPYSYSINGFIFGASPTFAGLASGNYVATLRDTKGCTDFLSITIDQPDLLQAVVDSIQEISCTPGGTGGIFISVIGGNGGNSFLWSNGDTTEDVTGLSAGIYTVAIVDSNGCSATIGASLTEPVPLFLSVASYQDLLCFNDSSGEIDITVNGGRPQYTFAWSTGATNEDVSNLPSGTYSVTVNDALGCADSLTQFIDQPIELTASLVPTNVLCAGGADGSIDLIVEYGTPGYTYTWNTGSTSEDLFNIPAGSYSVIVYDANGCRAVGTGLVEQPLAMIITTDVTNVLCHDSLTGAIDLGVTEGAGGFTYEWNTGYLDEDLIDIEAGTYSVTITDVSGCTASTSVTVSEPAALVVTGTTTNVCAGMNTGSIDISVLGGVTPYSYLWSTAATTEDVNGLASGIYDVTITDANDCTITQSFTVNGSTPIVSFVVGTDVTCNGANNGSADLTVVGGGVPPYTYLWNTFQNSEDLPAIGGGTYYVIITDANACQSRDSVVISEPTAMVLSTVITNTSCADSSAVIDLTATGGNGGNTFLWSTGETSEDIAGLTSGTYSVTVTDVLGCTMSTSATISVPLPLLLSVASYQNLLCYNDSSGEIDITVNGGVAPFTFAWSNGATNEDISNLAAGTYSVTVSDVNGCSGSVSQVLDEPIELTATLVPTSLLCADGSDGSIDLIPEFGTPGYSYLWNTGATSEDISNITAGTYSVVVYDANGCRAVGSTLVEEPLAMIVTTVVTNVLCHDSLTGAIDLGVTEGAGSYTYEWSTGYLDEDLIDIGAGTYTVTIMDANVCTVSASVVVTEPSAIVISGSVVNVLCGGNNDGSVSLDVFGGVPVYTFLWSNGATTQNIQNLPAGTVYVTVTDANACVVTDSFSVSGASAAITSVVTSTNILCNGSNTGTASVLASGGTPPYSYLWSNFQATPNISGLNGGTYYVIITDANDCTARDSAIISEPAPFIISVSSTNISCFNFNNGTITLNVSGASQPYSYLWSNNDSTATVDSLAGGTYTVTITDFNSCTTTSSATIINPSSIGINFVTHNPLCYQDLNGSIDLIPSGGTPNYSFNWSNTATTEDITAISAGVYTVTVTDANSCFKIDSTVIIEPSAFYVSGVVKHITCFGYDDGEIDATAYGGTLPYSFTWEPSGQSTEDLWDLKGGSDTVYVFDANGCAAVSIYVVNEPLPLTVDAVATNITCFGNTDGSLAAIPAGGTTPYNYLWSDFNIDSLHTGVSAGHYAIVLTDFNGCMTYDSVTVLEPSEMQITAAVTDATCNGFNTGAIDITVTGGTPTYTFVWSGGEVTEDLTALVAGTYIVTVTDLNSCKKSESFEVKDSPGLFTSVSSSNPICNGGNTGSILIVATGGVSPYIYSWSPDTTHTGSFAGNLKAGTYFITAADANNCSSTVSIALADPDSIVVTANAQAANCFNTTGSVTAGVTGGTAPYTYLLNGVAQTTQFFSNLYSGDYLILVMDVNGCQGKVPFSVNAPAQISVDITTPQQVILTGMETQLFATVDSGAQILHYYWSPDTLFGFNSCTDCSDPMVAPRVTTIFTVVVMNSDSCYASDTITIYVNNELSKFIPTAFTPNGDGLNDRFEIDILGVTKLEVSIFNRWGERVFYNADQANGTNSGGGWDGMVGGKPAPFDTYVYRIVATYLNNETKEIAGTVTIMK